ncbi:hypothetical protein KFK09_002279 [Dendrobium nobile]|uniref:Uncharacterized protein n=1 Tax=Dendrobium nobile TaxID=94219 RepID=A0A8T3CDB8_DENNO|nr:hypothetical protein KFK09_002279 [Dendrobium nobile]
MGAQVVSDDTVAKNLQSHNARERRAWDFGHLFGSTVISPTALRRVLVLIFLSRRPKKNVHKTRLPHCKRRIEFPPTTLEKRA